MLDPSGSNEPEAELQRINKPAPQYERQRLRMIAEAVDRDEVGPWCELANREEPSGANAVCPERSRASAVGCDAHERGTAEARLKWPSQANDKTSQRAGRGVVRRTAARDAYYRGLLNEGLARDDGLLMHAAGEKNCPHDDGTRVTNRSHDLPECGMFPNAKFSSSAAMHVRSRRGLESTVSGAFGPAPNTLPTLGCASRARASSSFVWPAVRVLLRTGSVVSRCTDAAHHARARQRPNATGTLT